MQHEVRPALTDKRVNDLLILTRAKRCHDHCLRLATREQGRAVRPRQKTSFGYNLPNGLCVASINTGAGFENRTTDDICLKCLDKATNQHGLMLIAKLFLCSDPDFGKRCLSITLVSNLVGRLELIRKTSQNRFDFGCLSWLLGKGAWLLGA